MKLSLSWIFDHIDTDVKDIDVAKLVDRFNQTTAEIEYFHLVTIPLESLFLVEVTVIDGDQSSVLNHESNATYTLPRRPESQVGDLFLVIKDETAVQGVRWAKLTDLGSTTKEGYVNALWCAPTDRAGAWKNSIPTSDWVIEIDNKSITNRPDLWGHRGIAREVAAILDLPFKSLDQFLIPKQIKQFDHSADASREFPFSISIKDQKGCRRFAGLYFENIERRSSLIWMALRLAQLDSRPIDMLVDVTNYVMLDLSQPMHAFDANTLPSNQILVRKAHAGEKLELLDTSVIELVSDDVVVTDGNKPVALAGVMGGKNSGITSSTTQMFLESACFDAVTIRRAAARHKIRTESSARFEKSLDPNQNVPAIMRVLKLLVDADVTMKVSDYIASLGSPAHPQIIEISHDFIQRRIGASVASEFVIATLERIGFEVTDNNGNYRIAVPTFRGTKDISIKEDIVEEIGRFIGYGSLEYVLPKREMAPFDTSWVMRTRAIKQTMAYALHMRELYQYAFYDESFLKVLGWEPAESLSVVSPVSTNWRRLITSLLPNLLKAVHDHAQTNPCLRFFEWGRVWHAEKEISEHKRLSGVMFEKAGTVDFYQAKAELTTLFDMLKIPVQWEQVDEQSNWYTRYKSARLLHNGQVIGHAGMLKGDVLERLTEGNAFIFELDGDYLLSYDSGVSLYAAPSKYPIVERDVSILIPISVTVAQLEKEIKQADKRIQRVLLVDQFSKPEWGNKKSLTLRFVIQDSEKTLEKAEADDICVAVHGRLEKLGAAIR